MRKIKRSTKQYLIVSLISLVVLIAAFVIAYIAGTKQIRNKYETKLSTLNEEISANKQFVYVAKTEIPRGEQINKNNTSYEEVFSDMQGVYITEEDMGKISVVDIQSGSHIMSNMITPEKLDNTLREEEFNQFYLSSNLMDNDYVDIRITYPNGENYIVLSKKAMKNINLQESDCFLWLTEEEIVTIQAAIVDAYKHTGSKIYTTKYIEPTIQDASIVTYTPPEEIIDLINRNPNILNIASTALSKEVRKSIDSRMKVYENSDGMQWEQSTGYADTENQLVENNQVNNVQDTTQETSLSDLGIEVDDNYAD